MIKANDLRIGNKVLNDSSICEVNHIYGMEFINCSLKTKQGNYINANYELIEPIQLTEEVLLKCKYINKVEKLNHYEFWTCIDNYIIIVYKQKTIDEPFYFLVNGFQNKKIKYLHEYQNLIYALTGSELIFSTTD